MFTLIALLLDNAGICGSVTSHKAALLAESVAAHRQEAARLAQEAERLAQEGERLAAIAQRLAEQKAERLANIGKGLGEMEEAAALAKLREPLDLAGRVKVCEGLREVVHCETKAKIRAGEGSTAANESEERYRGLPTICSSFGRITHTIVIGSRGTYTRKFMTCSRHPTTGASSKR